MSALGIVLLKLLRGAVLVIAAFLITVLAIEVWKHGWDLGQLNRTFMAVVALLAGGALWLARSIRKELAKHGS